MKSGQCADKINFDVYPTWLLLLMHSYIKLPKSFAAAIGGVLGGLLTITALIAITLAILLLRKQSR